MIDLIGLDWPETRSAKLDRGGYEERAGASLTLYKHQQDDTCTTRELTLQIQERHIT